MSAYHQMGHHSWNLLDETDLDAFQGAILSPVNNTEAEVCSHVVRAARNLDMIFDPQLYYPRSDRGELRSWRYYPDDVDTADLTSDHWWQQLVDRLIGTCNDVRPDAVCSPAQTPRTYTNEHYSQLVRVGNYLTTRLDDTGMRSIQTAVVGLADLSTSGRALEVASILSRTITDTIYLIFVGETQPRRELSETEELKGAMRLVASLESAGLRALVGFTSSDMVLWKAAGASMCATGKFFNLRRFTRARFEEPSEGGGQLPYWFEESLLAFLREPDVLRLQRMDRLADTSLRNPFGSTILDRLNSPTRQPWLGESWRQFMFAFASLEARISDGATDVSTLLADAENNWLSLEDAGFLMEEPRNNGSWVRPWRRALSEYQTP